MIRCFCIILNFCVLHHCLGSGVSRILLTTYYHLFWQMKYAVDVNFILLLQSISRTPYFARNLSCPSYWNGMMEVSVCRSPICSLRYLISCDQFCIFLSNPDRSRHFLSLAYIQDRLQLFTKLVSHWDCIGLGCL
jgi:hypothetical protein